MIVEIQTKAIVTVAEMARMAGLSRARFYQLLGTAFPFPLYDVATRRPFYTEEMQRLILDVRRRNCGIDGKPILFYARGGGITKRVVKKPEQARTAQHTDLIEGLKALGLVTVTAAEVQAAVKELFPQGTATVDHGELVRAIFLRLKRRDSADNVGR